MTDEHQQATTPATETIIDPFDAAIDEAIANANDDGMGNAAEVTDDGQQSQQDTGGDSTSTQQSKPDAQQQQQQQPVTPTAKPDQQGNLVGQQGEVIARAGAERRHFEKIQRENLTLREQLMEAQNVNLRGLSADEHNFATTFVQQLKTDPVTATRGLLQEVMKRGYSLPQIVGQNAEGIPQNNIDIGAISNMIDEKLRPFTEEREIIQEQQQARAEATEAIESFAAENDYAREHFGLMAQLINDNPGMTMERAYHEVYKFAVTHGLDFSKPLQSQAQPQSQQQQQPSTNGQRSAQPLPGQGTNGGIDGQQIPATRQPLASSDDSYDSIIRQSMTEAGMLQ